MLLEAGIRAVGRSTVEYFFSIGNVTTINLATTSTKATGGQFSCTVKSIVKSGSI